MKEGNLCNFQTLFRKSKYLLLIAFVQSFKTGYCSDTSTTILHSADLLTGSSLRNEHDLNKPILKTSDINCNEVIEVISPSDVSSKFHELLGQTFEPSSSTYAYYNAIGSRMIKYGVEVRKVCASCKNISDDARFLEKDAFVSEFCGTNVNGNDAIYSGLLLVPLTDSGSKKPGLSSAFIYSRSLIYDPQGKPPSESWNSMVQSDEQAIVTFLAATSGYVTIIPDFSGYGESSKYSVAQNILVKKSYLASTIPLWFQAGRIVRQESLCQSFLADASIFGGYDEGGYASLVLADGMKRSLNLDIIHVESGGTPYDIMTSVSDLVKESLRGGTSNKSKIWLEKISSSFSSSTILPMKLNSNQEHYLKRTFEPALVHTLKENSLTDIIRDSPFSIRLCHSTNDELFDFQNIPPFDMNPKHVQFLINDQYSHKEESSICSLSILTVLESKKSESFVIQEDRKEACISELSTDLLSGLSAKMDLNLSSSTYLGSAFKAKSAATSSTTRTNLSSL